MVSHSMRQTAWITATNPTSCALPDLGCSFALHSQLLYLEPEGVVLFDLPCQKIPCKLCLGSDSLGGEEVRVGKLVGAVAKVLDLHEPFVEQRSQHVVRLAEAHPKLVRHFSLGAPGARIEKTENTEKGGVGHGPWLERIGGGLTWMFRA